MSEKRPWYEHLLTALFLVHIGIITVVGIGKLDPDVIGPSAHTYNRSFRRPIDKFHRQYGALLGPKQYWSMFGGVGRNSKMMIIEIETDNEVRPVFVERSDTADWNRLAFDHYRWREWINQLNRQGGNRRFKRFVRWVGPRVAADFPEACNVWVRVVEGRALTPDELGAGKHREFPKRRTKFRYPVRPCQ